MFNDRFRFRVSGFQHPGILTKHKIQNPRCKITNQKRVIHGSNHETRNWQRSTAQGYVPRILKAQANSPDFIISIILFTIMLVFIVSAWNNSITNINEKLLTSRMESEAIAILETLLKSKGIPESWNSTNVQTVGLVTSQNELSAWRLSNFTSMSYEASKAALKTDYEFYFYVEDMDGNRLYEQGNSSTGEKAVSLTRFAVLNNSRVRVRVVIHG